MSAMMQDNGKDSCEWVIELLNKVTYHISVKTGDTWVMMKEKIKDKTNIPISEQHLFVGNTRIIDEHSLQNNDTKLGKIQLVKEVELLWYFSKHSMWDDLNVLVCSSTKEELCKAGAISFCGGTPLHFCCDRDAPVTLVTRLLNAFPEACKARNHFGSIPLHWAAFNGASADLLQILINANNCTLTMKDKKGDTPLLEALKCGNFLNNVAAIEILAGHNAASICDENGKSPSNWANDQGAQKAIVGLLLSYESSGTISDKPSVLDLNGGCYPQDTYSFLSKYGPLENIGCFTFGLVVFLFQVTFLVLIIVNIVDPTYSSTESGDGSHKFIPGDVEIPVKIAQYLAIAAFVFFADLTINDVIVSIDMLPLLSKKNPEDKVVCMFVSSFLRFVSGTLAVGVSFLLIITGPDVKEIVLNFTAINFISSLDDLAFDLAVKGHYGIKLKQAALDLEGEKLPHCIKNKNFDLFRKNFVLLLMLFSLIGLGGYFTFYQTNGEYLTDQFRVRFNAGSGLEQYSGCYDVGHESLKTVNAHRLVYKLYDNDDVSFGYCKEQQQWVLFDNSAKLNHDACKVVDTFRENLQAYSSKSISFDIEETFGNTWFSEGGSPLDLTFYEKDGEWTKDECDASFGDGECFNGLNNIDYEFDGGDCCGATCNLFECGAGALYQAFNVTLNEAGDGFPYCKNPDMVNITIRINSIETKETLDTSLIRVNTTLPLLTVACDERTYMMVKLQNDMNDKNETVSMSDAANCTITTISEEIEDLQDYANSKFVNESLIKWATSAVHYEIYQVEGEETIMILNETNQTNSINNFQLVPKCYFTKLSDHVDLATLYGKDTSQTNAIYWLMKDKSRYSSCEMPNFLERYALTVMFFDTILDNETGWIDTNTQCRWDPVICGSGGYLNTLDFFEMRMKGTIATEIGLFPHMSVIRSDNSFTGTLPTELGQLKQLKTIQLAGNATRNQLTGTLPTELYQLEQLKNIILWENNLTGTLSTALGQLDQLQGLSISTNKFNGTLPTELGQLDQLRVLTIHDNGFTGTVPTELGQLEQLQILLLDNNTLTGTLPTELSQLKRLKILGLAGNDFVGTIPNELCKLLVPNTTCDFTLMRNN